MCTICGDTKHIRHIGPLDQRRDFLRQAATVGTSALLIPALLSQSVLAKAAPGIPAIGYAKSKSDQPLTPFSFTRDGLRSDEMLVDILYCGVCHSDIHSAQGPLDYTLVPGHEIVGRVARVGPAVHRFKVGDAVGVGPVLDSCRTCDNCRRGQQQYCTNPAFTFTAGKGPAGGQARFGGYANNIVVGQDYAIRIPERMNLAATAPLLCAGITAWSPIKAWKAGKGNQVGVIGMGGLGHLGLKFLADSGADVTVFTTTPSKHADAKRFGAREVVAIGDKNAFARLANNFDLLLSTMPVPWDMGSFVNLLARDGTLVDIGLMNSVPPLPTVALALNRRRLASSMAGGIAETQSMIDYCAGKGIAAEIEIIPITQVNAAWERIAAKDVRYRFVIDMKSLHTGS